MIKKEEYCKNPVYKEIATRFLRFNPRMQVDDYIDSMADIGPTHSEGITFVVQDDKVFTCDLLRARVGTEKAFHWDDRKVWIFELAALATDGEGYREIGQPSLHCAVSKTVCNVHIDEFGFVAIGPDGKEYLTPDLVRHIFDELIYRAKIRPKLAAALNKVLPSSVANVAVKLFDFSYLVLPSQENQYDRRVGVGVKFKVGQRIELRFEYTCGNGNCSDNYKGVSVSIPWD